MEEEIDPEIAAWVRDLMKRDRAKIRAVKAEKLRSCFSQSYVKSSEFIKSAIKEDKQKKKSDSLVCPTCLRSLSNSQSLNQHVRIHTGRSE